VGHFLKHGVLHLKTSAVAWLAIRRTETELKQYTFSTAVTWSLEFTVRLSEILGQLNWIMAKDMEMLKIQRTKKTT